MQTIQTNNIDIKKVGSVLIILAIVVVLIIIIKNVSSFINMFGKGASEISKGLGVDNSDSKKYVNDIYNSQDSPLFSNEFDKMQRVAPNNAPLKTVAEMHTHIETLKDARGFLFDNDAEAVGVFDNFNTQFMVAWFSKRFFVETGKDLFAWLRKDDTLFSQGFAAGTVEAIIKKVNSYPRY